MTKRKKKKSVASDGKIFEAKQRLVDPKTGKEVDGVEEKILCIYVPCSWPFLYTKFFQSFLKIIHPMNIFPLRKLFGVTSYFVLVYNRFPVCRNRNEAVLKIKEYNVWKTLFLDADMEHPPDIIKTLASHDKPIVGGMYWHQTPPHMPVIYRSNLEAGPHHYDHITSYPNYDLFQVDLTGMGCLLVDMQVFNDIEMPYFDYLSTREDGIRNVTEDVIFCEKVRKVGYEINIDPMVKCEHIRMDSVGEQHFDSYMQAYKTGEALIREFGDGSGE